MFREIKWNEEKEEKKEQSCKKNTHFLQRALSLIKMDLHSSLKYMLDVQKDLGEREILRRNPWK